VVAVNLGRQGFEEYVPLITGPAPVGPCERTDTVLFPGYIFCRFPRQERLRVLNSPGVESIVRFGKTDIPVDDAEIRAVRTLVAQGRPLAPWPFLRIGQDVAIESGPLAGLRGVVLRDQDSWRVVVSVEALDRSLAVVVDRDMICPENSFPHGCH
jgi:transcription antitermination factor NusG